MPFVWLLHILFPAYKLLEIKRAATGQQRFFKAQNHLLLFLFVRLIWRPKQLFCTVFNWPVWWWWSRFLLSFADGSSHCHARGRFRASRREGHQGWKVKRCRWVCKVINSNLTYNLVISKSLELDNELRMVGNNLKSLEANGEKVSLWGCFFCIQNYSCFFYRRHKCVRRSLSSKLSSLMANWKR